DGAKQGMVMDFSDVKKYLKPLIDEKLDHYYLNETTGLESPTSENIARYVYDQLKPNLSNLVGVRIDETCTSSCMYAPEFKPSYLSCFSSDALSMG
ncbi:MAG: 6-pyruvoyl trahydropterin synthase family protein, partial [Dolichospermum sp.]